MPTMHLMTMRCDAWTQASPDDLHKLAYWLQGDRKLRQTNGNGPPFAAWPLQPSDRDDECVLRINWLGDEATAYERLTRGLHAHPRLGTQAVEPLEITSSSVTYAQLRDQAPLWDADLAVLSPTYFSRSGRDYLLPDPILVTRTLLSKWNACVDAYGEPAELISDDEQHELLARIVMKAHDLRTVRVTVARGHARTGFVGQLRLGFRSPDRRSTGGQTAARLLAALCAFATYSGLGAQTTYGLGAVTLLAR